MAKFISELEVALGTYVHPQLTFIDVLNEVLPQLASRGIWKDLTYESSVEMHQDERFFSLPEDAESVLYGMADNWPSPVKPLWQAYVNKGASSSRPGAWYGVEDAGFAPTKGILSSEFYYALYVFPDFRWGEMEDQTAVRTDSAFAGTEKITIMYENWEGIVKEVTDTVSASTSPQLLSPRAVRNIKSISYTGFDTVPALVVAVPVKHFGLFSWKGGTSFDISSIPELPANYTDLGTSPVTVDMYSLLNDTSEIDVNEDITFSIVSDTLMNNTSYSVTTGQTLHPVMVLPTTQFDDALFRNNYAAAPDSKKMANLSGSGICRYRVFRNNDPGNTLHLLYKRRIPKYVNSDEIVYLDNLSALKYAILANTAEYNNDFTAAQDWWDAAEEELNRELASSLGAATPIIPIDPSGGLGSIESLV